MYTQWFLHFQNEVSINYLKQTNFMFLGGLILALAVEHSGLHLRIALNILVLIGVSPAKVLSFLHNNFVFEK